MVAGQWRRRLQTEQRYRRMHARFGDHGPQLRCHCCWLLRFQCICRPTPPEVLEAFPHRILVYLHCNEYGRLSNTGGLVQVLPTILHTAPVFVRVLTTRGGRMQRMHSSRYCYSPGRLGLLCRRLYHWSVRLECVALCSETL